MELPKRRPNRLQKYDYGQPGCYFITICTKNRVNLLWERDLEAYAVGAACGRPPLSNIGKVVEQEIEKVSHVYPLIVVDKYVVMPNHIHMIVRIRSGESGRPQAAPTVARMVNQFKGKVTKMIGYPVWQRSFYDHVIRNDTDYLRIWTYIDTNPARWREDEYCEE